MKDQPKPATGALTFKRLEEMTEANFRLVSENAQLREQLAAEREKVQTLQDALTWMDESVLVNPKNWIRAEDNPGFHRHE